MNTKLKVVAYDPSWVQTYEMLRSFVFPVVCDIIVGIDHVGSTSVPGLAAKPIIDMDVVVATQQDLTTAIERLATLGYVHEDDLGVKGREAFIPPDNLVWHHLYACTVDNTDYKRHILFRDYLRSHPEDAKRYGSLKMALAERFSNDRAAYTLAKSDFVLEILQRTGRP
ncbi:GrpB family protein [Paenibacillus sp. 5J-6]|uniref:GrpB family protein n=1 Tax=Paenibacillus silvestris TaxID=2606219 RepID=A0A6L8V898_9BACL|nr:GrpB family protein [Paenibacillus silvestris]MZQ86578.1 GrpB family protein [Paenibacillus silvestris]